MAEVYDPSDPYGSSGIEDPSNTGAFLDWQTAISLGLVSGYPGYDPSNPFDTAYDPNNILSTGTLTGGFVYGPGSIEAGLVPVGFGGQGIAPYPGPAVEQNYGPEAAIGSGFDSGHGSLDPNVNPTQYPGSQFPNIGIGIPGIIGIGAGGVMTGGLLDLIGGGGGGTTVGPGAGGPQGDPNAVLPLPGVYGGPSATVGPGLGGEQSDPNAILPLPGIYSDSGATVGPGLGGDTPTGPATIVPPPTTNPTTPPNVPGENPQPNTIYAPLWNAFNPGTNMPPAMGPTGAPQPTQLPLDPTTAQPPLNRNYYNEGAQGLYDLQRLGPGMLNLYGQMAGGYAQSDFDRYQSLLGGLGQANQTLSGMAADQTRYANTALRSGNLQDVNTYGQQALALRQQANQELYGNLNRLDAAAGQQAGAGGQNFLNALLGQGGLQPSSIQTTLEQQAAQGLAQGRGLSADDVRMAQQAAREGSAARGRLGDQSSIAAEVLNRDALARQRENERRAFAQSVDQAGFGQRAAGLQGNIGLGQAVGGMDLARQQQSFNQLLGATQARTANAFDPFGTILGAQYGMQTSNVGNNQQLFNNATGFSSGAYGNQYVQNAYSPYNNYAADVYGSNFNAANARQIASNNSAAAADAAQQALLGNALGSLFKTGVQTGWRFGF